MALIKVNKNQEGKRQGDLVFWETERNFTRTTITIAADQEVDIGSLLTEGVGGDYTVADSGTPEIDAISLMEVTTGADETCRIAAIVRGPAIVVRDFLEAGTMTSAHVDAQLNALDILVKDAIEVESGTEAGG